MPKRRLGVLRNLGQYATVALAAVTIDEMRR